MKIFKTIIMSLVGILLLLSISFLIYKFSLQKQSSLSDEQINVYSEIVDVIGDPSYIEVQTLYVDDEMYFESTPVMFKNYFYEVLMTDSFEEANTYYYEVTNIDGETGTFLVCKDGLALTDFKEFSANSSYYELNLEKFYENHNIYNDMDLFDYLVNNYDNVSSIFTSSYDMKSNYNIKISLIDILDDYTSYTILKGDLSGYVFTTIYDSTSIVFYEEEVMYTLTFDNTFFTEDIIENIIETLTIRK